MCNKIYVTEKRCSHCKKIKPSVDFYFDGRSKTGLQSLCKVCHRECKRPKTYTEKVQAQLYQKKYYAAHREYYQAIRDRNREAYNAKKRLARQQGTTDDN